MKKLKYYVVFASVVCLSSACSDSAKHENVASVGGEIITKQEFTLRHNFNPYLFNIHDKTVAKKTVLASLIAEKLLSREARKQNFLPEQVKYLIDAHKREAIIEELRRDSVEKQIRISEKELSAEYEKALTEIEVEYIEVGQLSTAQALRAEMLKGRSFREIRRKEKRFADLKTEPLSKKITWPIGNPVLESEIYKLKLNEISKPLANRGNYYLVIVRSIHKTAKPTVSDFRNRKNALEDHILRRKIKDRYSSFFYRHLEKRLGRLNQPLLMKALNLLARQTDFRQPNPPRPFGEFMGLPDGIYAASQTLETSLSSASVVNFPSGKSWSVRQVFRHLKYGPYAFKYSDAEAFEHTFLTNVNLLLEHQALYEMAHELGYEKKNTVLRETAMWDSYYTSSAFRHHLLEGLGSPGKSRSNAGGGALTAQEEQRLDFMDNYLSDLAARYEIEINSDVFKQLKLEKQDMLLMKTHYAHRLVAPLLEPLEGMPRWQKKINALFSKSGIN